MDERLKGMREVLLWDEELPQGTIVIVRDGWDERCFRMKTAMIAGKMILVDAWNDEWPDRRKGVRAIIPTPALHYYVPPGGTNEE